MTEITEPERATRRKEAHQAIETAVTEMLQHWSGPARPTPTDIADAALAGLGERAAEILTDGTMLRSLTIRNGVATLELGEATEILKIFVASMRGVLDGYGAENYVETEMTAPSVSMDLRDGTNPHDAYTVTIQRRTRPTPHELRQRAEKHLDQALQIIADWYLNAATPHDRDPDELYPALERAGFTLPGLDEGDAA